MVDHAVNYLDMRTNCLLADISLTDSNTLSSLFNTYCTNIYSSPLWKHFDIKLQETILYCLEKIYQKSLENSLRIRIILFWIYKYGTISVTIIYINNHDSRINPGNR